MPQAGEEVAEQNAETTSDGKCQVNFQGLEEFVADKGYHSNEVLRNLTESGVRTYIAEPERGARKWEGRQAEQAAVYANRRRIRGARGSDCRPCVANVHKKLLIQPAPCNLALLIRTLYGTGKPRAAHNRRGELAVTVLRLYSVLNELCDPESAFPRDPSSVTHRPRCRHPRKFLCLKNGGLGTDC